MKESYNYYEAVKNDVMYYIDYEIDFSDYEEIEDLEEYLNDILWSEDCVTGNGSGSYTFSSYQAEENLCHNLDLLSEAAGEFGSNIDILNDGPEACDVLIRCYLLSGVISDVIEEITDDFEEAHEESEEE